MGSVNYDKMQKDMDALTNKQMEHSVDMMKRNTEASMFQAEVSSKAQEGKSVGTAAADVAKKINDIAGEFKF